MAPGKKRQRSLSRSEERREVWFLVPFFLVLMCPGAASETVDGQKGGSVTLKCGLTTSNDLDVLLTYGPSTAYGFQQDEPYRGRVNRTGHCDLILQDLKTTDAGKYIIKLYNHDGLISNINHEIHVHDSLTAQEGEELVFGDLPREAESVERQDDRGWTEVWRRGQGVLSDRLTDDDGRLTIRNFTSNDAGTYRVLNKTRGTLITVKVEEPGTKSKRNLDSTEDHRSDDTEQCSVWVCIVVPVVLVVLVILGLIMFPVIKKIKSDTWIPTSDQNQIARFLPGVPMP